jgi:hypothetical protein
MNVIMKWPTCPRCNGNLAKYVLEQRYICKNCKLNYDQFTQEYQLEINNGLLLWKFNYAVCEFGNVKLPWLPYNISLEQLKLYLTFQ